MRTRKYIDQVAEDALLNYKYHGADHSFLSKVLTPFWEFVCQMLPSWMAPNLLTFISFSCTVLVYVTLIITHPHFEMNTGVWYYPYMFIIFGILIFIYQTLDAVDGKQARRTKSSSALGELFDHGCDALTVTFQSALCCSMLGYGNSSASFWFHLGSCVVSHICLFEEYTTLLLRFGKFNSVTEILAVFEICLILNGILRGFPWRIEIPFLSRLIGEKFTIGWFVALSSIIVAPLNIYEAFKYTRQEIAAQTEQVKERGLTFMNSIMGLIPGSIIIVIFTAWFFLDEELYGSYVFLFCSTFTLCMSYLSTRMIIHRVCKQHMKPFYLILIPVIAGFVLCNFVIGPSSHVAFRLWTFIGMLCVIVVIYVHFVYYTINEITAVLGIYLFSLKKRR